MQELSQGLGHILSVFDNVVELSETSLERSEVVFGVNAAFVQMIKESLERRQLAEGCWCFAVLSDRKKKETEQLKYVVEGVIDPVELGLGATLFRSCSTAAGRRRGFFLAGLLFSHLIEALYLLESLIVDAQDIRRANKLLPLMLLERGQSVSQANERLQNRKLFSGNNHEESAPEAVGEGRLTVGRW